MSDDDLPLDRKGTEPDDFPRVWLSPHIYFPMGAVLTYHKG